ncbi:uncharacterized protein OCT59_023196 [Rhizophagus irregularis]|uniref:Kel2p n=3 Tax=Rhizophagus irregularis TaxID=588596 RepID=A0A015LR21_RHIIW|nr:hypothetical protein GLOIN_2v1870208 [Rhizophagus irregularis DAOM 181602=DAOM 197198]EXX57143.1 Kel2p [Rhizophagus irregularis DAOM 197198w]POG78879.1 hypothetical protein GLOIN_2v1870208 [Rhizophagus irregularis DAOM 181602=DAOM 197198]UZO29736.1 hypothetical protein OCT59_023196 [Rhizophagus irregularis]|eukprot:XP_025185745.1 hypothetical protein GLOIN_2v1870208 [Rhizophagus irregularis DAOM 181602=DAOM 197198]
MIINNLNQILLLIILLIEIGQSLAPVERSAHSSVLVDKKLFFFGGHSDHSLKKSVILDQIIYLDVSKPFNTANPPFEEISKTIPFGSSFATAFLSPQKNIIYLFGGIVKDEKRNNGVINNKTGKFYVFGGAIDPETGSQNIIILNDMNIFDTISLTWSKGSSIYAPLPRVDFTTTLLSNGIIVFIGGRETNNLVDVDINQLVLYDTTIDKWSSMMARGVILENRNAHSAVLTPDERIIIFGGCKGYNETILNQLAVLNTKTYPYEWSIPQVSALNSAPPLIYFHSATLIENYMFINFGQNYELKNPELQKPFFYILDIRNFTWVTQFEPEQPEQLPVTTNSVTPIATATITNTSLTNLTAEKSGQIGIILGAVGLSVVIITVAGFLGYKFYKKQKYNRAIPTAGEIQS